MIAWLSIVQLIPSLILLFWQKPSMGLRASILVGAKWYIISGIIGIIVIAALSFAIPKIGSLSVFVILILGQIIGAAIIDQIGLFGSPVVRINSMRIVSIAIITVGVVLLLKSAPTNSSPKETSINNINITKAS